MLATLAQKLLAAACCSACERGRDASCSLSAEA